MKCQMRPCRIFFSQDTYLFCVGVHKGADEQRLLECVKDGFSEFVDAQDSLSETPALHSCGRGPSVDATVSASHGAVGTSVCEELARWSTSRALGAGKHDEELMRGVHGNGVKIIEASTPVRPGCEGNAGPDDGAYTRRSTAAATAGRRRHCLGRREKSRLRLMRRGASRGFMSRKADTDALLQVPSNAVRACTLPVGRRSRCRTPLEAWCKCGMTSEKKRLVGLLEVLMVSNHDAGHTREAMIGSRLEAKHRASAQYTCKERWSRDKMIVSEHDDCVPCDGCVPCVGKDVARGSLRGGGDGSLRQMAIGDCGPSSYAPSDAPSPVARQASGQAASWVAESCVRNHAYRQQSSASESNRGIG